MAGILPKDKPRLSSTKLHEMMQPFNIDRAKHPLVIIGIRGYYRDTLGVVGKNDRGMYDDAIFIDSPNVTAAYNANTDPSRIRKGSGTGTQKGMAKLKAGLWMAHKFDWHGSKYNPHPAICQRLGSVTVIRDGVESDYEHIGNFGINIHCGGINGTSSEGCQTLPPSQWTAFYEQAKAEATRIHGKNWGSVVIPYLLLENNGEI